MKNFMRFTLITIAIISVIAMFTGCETEAQRVSYNLSQEADNFNDIRQLTVINCLQGDVLFQMTGKMSITADTEDNQLEVIVEDEIATHKTIVLDDYVNIGDKVYVNTK